MAETNHTKEQRAKRETNVARYVAREAKRAAAEAGKARREGRDARPPRKTSPNFVIRVTQQIIDTAVPKDSNHCMVADAIKAALPEAASVTVDLQSVRFSDPSRGLRYVYLTPRIAQEALILFDEGMKVPPFECRLSRASQIVSMYRRKPGGSSVKIHLFGRKSVQLEDGGRGAPTVIGGKPPPVINHPNSQRAERNSPRPDSRGSERNDSGAAGIAEQGRLLRGRPRLRRQYGMRAFKIGSMLPGRV